MTRRAVGAQRADVTAWTVDGLRCTVFTSLAGLDSVQWWNELVEAPPETTTEKPRTGEVVQIGRWGDWQLALHFQPQDGRVDLFARNAEDDPQVAPLGPLPDRIQAFSDLAARLLARPDIPNVTRMAFGCVAELTVADIPAAYRMLSNYLDFDVDRATASDFLYQINRPRDSASVPGLRINRLTKWSSIRFTQHRITLQGDVAVDRGDAVPVRNSCRIDFDINTIPSDAAIPNASLVALFTEMTALAEEIVREGDIP